jgi:hypothetical protein
MKTNKFVMFALIAVLALGGIASAQQLMLLMLLFPKVFVIL